MKEEKEGKKCLSRQLLGCKARSATLRKILFLPVEKITTIPKSWPRWGPAFHQVRPQYADRSQSISQTLDSRSRIETRVTVSNVAIELCLHSTSTFLVFTRRADICLSGRNPQAAPTETSRVFLKSRPRVCLRLFRRRWSRRWSKTCPLGDTQGRCSLTETCRADRRRKVEAIISMINIPIPSVS